MPLHKRAKLVCAYCAARFYEGAKCTCPVQMTVSPQTEKNIYDQVNKEPMMKIPVIRKIDSWIKSFNDSKNPAVKTEVMTGIEILIKSGLDTRENIPSNYELHVNPATSDMFNDVKGIINTTQDDNCG